MARPAPRSSGRPGRRRGPGQLLWILLPIGAATLLRWRGGDGFNDAGLRLRYRQNRRWYDFSSAFYPVVMLAAAAGGLATDHWRGYLTPRLDAAGVGRFTNHLVVGLIWGAWHLPYLTAFWSCSDESLWTLAPRVMLGTTAAAVVYGEIRLRTGTVWPAVVMHAAGNAIAAALLDENVLIQNEGSPWMFAPGIDSLAVLTATALVAALLFRSR